MYDTRSLRYMFSDRQGWYIKKTNKHGHSSIYRVYSTLATVSCVIWERKTGKYLLFKGRSSFWDKSLRRSLQFCPSKTGCHLTSACRVVVEEKHIYFRGFQTCAEDLVSPVLFPSYVQLPQLLTPDWLTYKGFGDHLLFLSFFLFQILI